MIKQIVLAAMLATGPAMAQVVPEPAPKAPDSVLELQQDWQAYGVSEKHIAMDLSNLIVEIQRLRAEVASLKAEAERATAAPAPSTK
jgi:hypothetical protein